MKAAHGSIAAVILAGGRSSRMGRNKAELMWRGQPLLDHVAHVVEEAGFSSVFISGSHPKRPCIPDHLAGFVGPVVGICSALLELKAQASAVLFLPVDLPLLTPNVLRELTARTHSAVFFEEHPLPCVIRLDTHTYAFAEETLAHLKQGQNIAVYAFLALLGAQTLPLTPAVQRALTNTNTPEQWGLALETYADEHST